jgi:putative hydrolase of the HAD superfamily
VAKPAASGFGICRTACDLAQVASQEVVCLEDRAMFVEVAATLGIRGIVVHGVDNPRAALVELGLYEKPAAFVA